MHYKHYFNNHWSVDGGANLQYTKGLYGFKAKGEYHLKIKKFHMFASGEYMFNHYHRYNTNENIGNMSVRFERGYWDITLGGSLISYSMLGDHYTEPLTLTFGAHQLGTGLLLQVQSQLETLWRVQRPSRGFDEPVGEQI